MNIQFEPGAPVEGGIPLSIPVLGDREAKYLMECVTTTMVSSVGPFVQRFESLVAERVGAPYGVAMMNGTAALHIALLLAGVERDDEVVMPALTFVAPANAVRYCGAWPVFVDVEPEFRQIDTGKLAAFLAEECFRDGEVLRNRTTGRRVRALLPVHLLGHPVDLDPIRALADQYALALVEDAAEAMGSEYKGKPVGSGSRLACFSFNGNKIVTAGGGGVLVTSDERLARKARYLATQAKDDALEYVHHEVGYNYRMTNMQAAVGCAQMERLDEFVAAKRRIAATYETLFAGVPGITVPHEAEWAGSTFWLYTIDIDESQFGASSRQVLRTLLANRIQARPLWHPLHTLRPFQQCMTYQVTVADRMYESALSLPCTVSITEDEQQRVADVVCGVVARAQTR